MDPQSQAMMVSALQHQSGMATAGLPPGLIDPVQSLPATDPLQAAIRAQAAAAAATSTTGTVSMLFMEGIPFFLRRDGSFQIFV